MTTRAPDKPKIAVIAGPTCCGKSDAAVRISLERNGEVISCDSMQAYRGMNIGTAKIRPEEMRGVPHHLIDILDVSENFSAKDFQTLAKEALSGTVQRGCLPVLCGGTGFFIQSVIYDIEFAEKENFESGAIDELDRLNLPELKEILRSEDSLAFENIDIKNKRKVVRAIAFKRHHGESIVTHNLIQAQKKLDPPYDIRYFVLFLERRNLYEKIDERVDQMIEEGLIDEVGALMKKGLSGDKTAAQAIGYKEIMEYLSGNSSLPEAIDRIKLHTRRYAKRQFTWFRREKTAHWIDIEKGDPLDEIRRYI